MLAKRSRVMQVSCLTSHFDRRRLDVFETGVVDLDTLIFRRGVRVLTKATRHEKKKCKLRSSKSTTLKTLILCHFLLERKTSLSLAKSLSCLSGKESKDQHVPCTSTHGVHMLYIHYRILRLSHCLTLVEDSEKDCMVDQSPETAEEGKLDCINQQAEWY